MGSRDRPAQRIPALLRRWLIWTHRYVGIPLSSLFVHSVHRYSRLERWPFNGLHSLDFAFWYDRRPLWDIGLIALMPGGLASSGIGLWHGSARVGRALGRFPAGRAVR